MSNVWFGKLRTMGNAGEHSAEAALRAEISACTRILNMEGILGYSGHVSARVPGRDAFLIQPFDRSRAQLEPDDLLVVDMDGGVLDGRAGARPPSEVHIHSEILKARMDVNSVAHFHPEIATLFTLIDDVPLRPVKNHAARWASGIPVHGDLSHVDTPALGRALADTLGGHHAALIRAHGVVLVAESVPAVMVDAVHFEENANAMYRAASIGKLRPLSPGEMEAFAREFNRDRHVAKLWTYYLGRAADKGVLPDGS